MKKHLSIFLIFISLTSVSYTQWTSLTLPVSGTVYDMYFVNQNTGWVTLYNPYNTIKQQMVE